MSNTYNHTGEGSPYYDDFKPENNYLKVAFKPSIAIQSRELTTMQSSMQNQLASLGGYMFKDGTPISGAKITVSYQQPRMKARAINSEGDPVIFDYFVGKRFVGLASNQMIVITDAVPEERVFLFSYMGSELVDGEGFVSYKELTPLYFTMEKGSIGNAVVASCTQGTLFVDGYFATIPKSNIIVSTTSNPETMYNIGYKITRNFITNNDDGSLNDPAAGSFNFKAPGADRYQLDISLSAFENGNEPENDDTTINYVTGVIVRGDTLIKDQQYDPNSTLMDVMARRTYEESGSYTIDPWTIQIKEHEDKSKYIVSVLPGAGYIHGYRISNLVSKDIINHRSRTYMNKYPNVGYIRDCTYTLAKYSDQTRALSAKSFPNFLQMETVEVMDGLDGTGTVLGECIITDVYKEGVKFFIYLTDTVDVLNAFSGAKSLRSKASPNLVWVNLALNELGCATISGSDHARIIKSPYTMLKEIIPNTVEYEYLKSYTVTSDISGNTLTLIEPDQYVDFPSYDSLAYIIEHNTGTQIDITNLSMVPDNSSAISSAKIYGPAVKNATTYTTVVRVKKRNGSARTKVAKIFKKTVTIPVSQTSVVLDHEDIIKIVSIEQKTSRIQNYPADVKLADFVTLDNGQRMYTYEKGVVSGFGSANFLPLIALNATKAEYEITYQYYEHTGTGPFSASSYINNNNKNILSDVEDIYTNIPQYRSPTGEVYTLRDCLDFRIKRSELEKNISYFPVPRTEILYSADIYLPRMDTVWIDKNGNFGLTEGIPAEKPEVPETKDGTMVIYHIYNTAYTNDIAEVVLRYINNQRHTMSDINGVANRLYNVESILAVTLLEQAAINTKIVDVVSGVDKFKSGIFTDDFSSFSGADYENPEWNASIDSIEQSLRPQYDAQYFEFKNVPELSVNCLKSDKVVSLPYTVTIYAQNPIASETTNIQSLMFFVWNGNIKLTPSIDNWVNNLGNIVISSSTSVQGRPPSAFRSWSNSNTTPNTNPTSYREGNYQYYSSWSIQDQYTSRERQDEYMREIDVAYSASGLRPGMTITATMDNVPLNLSNDKTDSSGNLTGTFKVPPKMLCGTKLVSFKDTTNTSFGDVQYTASGKTIWNDTHRKYIQTWTAVYVDPLAQSFLVSETNGITLDSIDIFFAEKDDNIDVSLYVVECVNGYPSQTMVPFSKVSVAPKDVKIGLDNPTKFKFESPIYLQPLTEYAFVLVTPSYKYEVYTSTLSKPDLKTGIGISEQPYLGTMFKSQNARTWTAEQMTDIKFTMYQCVFDTTKEGIARFSLDAPEKPYEAIGQTFVSNIYAPNGTKVKCRYKWRYQADFVEYVNRSDVFNQTLQTIEAKEEGIPSSLDLEFVMSTENPAISPMIDLEQVYGIFMNNTVQEESDNKEFPYDCGTYISKVVNLNNPADDMRIILDAILPGKAEAEVMVKTSSYKPLYVVQSSKGGLCVDPVAPKNLIGQNVQMYYYNNTTKNLEPKTQAIVTGFKAEGRQVFLRSVGNPADFHDVMSTAETDNAYDNLAEQYIHILLLPVLSSTNIACPSWSAKTFPEGSFVIHNGYVWRCNRDALSQNTPSEMSIVWNKIDGIKTSTVTKLDTVVEWRKFGKSVNELIGKNTETEFVEYSYSPEIGIETEFSSFQIKIQLKSKNKVDVPRVKNLRAIAVA